MKKNILFAAAVLMASTAFAGVVDTDEIIFAPAETEVYAKPGETFDLTFNLTNTVKCTTFQLWLEAPENIDVVYDADEEDYAVDFGERLSANYSLTTAYKKDSRDFLVLGFNATGKKLMPFGEGLFCTVTLQVPEDYAEGDYTIKMKDSNFNWSGEGDIMTIKPADADITLHVTTSGIDGINVDKASAEKVYFDLTGRRVENPAAGLYIVRQGNESVKTIIR